MAARDDEAGQSIVGSCASALVRYHRSAIQPAVTDVERLYPAWEFDPPISVSRYWSLEEYGKLIEPQLSEIEYLEAGPKIFGEVRKVWCGSME